jgi:outer membrane receptor for ferrienterochelin and colicin
MHNIQQYGTYAPTARISFRDANVSVSQDIQLDNRWVITPRASYRDEADWQSSSTLPDYVYDYDVRATRIDASVDAKNQYSETASINVGVYGQKETARAIDVDMPLQEYFPPNGKLSYKASAVYGNWDVLWDKFDVSLGARASNHDYSGSSFTPRIGVTRAQENWHVKWLYGAAYREPDIQTSNPRFHPGTAHLNPESTRVSEFEFGHTLSQHNYLTVSLFNQTIHDAIIYSYLPGYTNNPPIITRGIDLQYWYKTDGFNLQANYNHSLANDDDLAIYNVQGHSGQNVGAAADIANFWFSWQTPIAHLSVQADLRYVGKRYAQVYDKSLNTIHQQALNAEATINGSMTYELLHTQFTLGVHNLTDERQFIPQPYNDVSTPFPFDSRELWLKVALHF